VPEVPKRAPPEKKIAVPKREEAPTPKGTLKDVIFFSCYLKHLVYVQF